MKEIADKVLNRIVLSDLIETRLTLKGHEHIGLCPFHNEKSPSFSVNNAKHVYHCFGCGASGNAFTYVMEKKGYTFKDALRHLCGLCNIPFEEKIYERDEKEPYFEILKKANAFFLSNVCKVHDYLKTRHIPEQVLKKFDIGFWPKNTNLFEILKQSNAEKSIEESGLFYDQRKGRFEGRVTFPIKNPRGDVIAFGGRALESHIKPKYINSPETKHFDKKSTFYGFYERSHKHPFIVVEGYLDVLKLHAHGYEAAISPMGTSLSENHLLTLWQYQRKPIICFDGDEAGFKAMLRTVQLALPLLTEDASLDFIMMPAGEDPDSLLDKDAQAFKNLFDAPQPFIEILWTIIKKPYNLNIPEDFIALKTSIYTYAKKIKNESLQKQYQRELLNHLYGSKKTPKKFEKTILSPVAEKNKDILEEILLAVVINHPILLDEVHENFGRVKFSNPLLDEYRCRVLSHYHEQKPPFCDKNFYDEKVLKTYAPFINEKQSFDDVQKGFWEIWEQLYTNEIKKDDNDTEQYWKKLRHLKTHLIKGEFYG